MPEPPLRKSERTRAAIADAARKLFAAKGFEHATVREIADAAGIDPAMIIRYFGSKDALFAEVAVFDLRLPDLREIDESRIGETLVRHFLLMWEDSAGEPGMTILLKSATSNDHAAAKMRDLLAGQIVPALARIGQPETLPKRAALIATQMLGLALTRYVLKLPPVVRLTPETIIREVGPTIQRYALAD